MRSQRNHKDQKFFFYVPLLFYYFCSFDTGSKDLFLYVEVYEVQSVYLDEPSCFDTETILFEDHC